MMGRWKELKYIIENNKESLIERDKKINCLKEIIKINYRENKIYIDDDIVINVFSLINKYDPFFHSKLKITIGNNEEWKYIPNYFNYSVELVSTLIVTILVGALSQNEKLPATVIQICILNFITSHLFRDIEENFFSKEINQQVCRLHNKQQTNK